MQTAESLVDRKKETLAALRQFSKGPGSLKLLQHAIWESRSFYWRTGTGKMSYAGGERAALAEGNSPEDVAQEAVLRTIDGRRPWNRDKHPDILAHLKLVVTRLTRNLASSGDNRKLRAMPQDEDGRIREDRLPLEAPNLNGVGEHDDLGEDDDPGSEVAEPKSGEAEPPEATALRCAEGAEAVDLENRVFEAISDDPQLLKVCEYLMDGKKPRQIMEVMTLPREEVYRLTQKLRRRLIKAGVGPNGVVSVEGGS